MVSGAPQLSVTDRTLAEAVVVFEDEEPPVFSPHRLDDGVLTPEYVGVQEEESRSAATSEDPHEPQHNEQCDPVPLARSSMSGTWDRCRVRDQSVIRHGRPPPRSLYSLHDTIAADLGAGAARVRG